MKRKNISKCRRLRKNQTDAERKLWLALRNHQLGNVKFRRQHAIDKYIVDFYCPRYKIAIEADGGQHYEDRCRRYDLVRTKELGKCGIKVLRFSDLDVLNNIEGVCEEILNNLPLTPALSPSPSGDGERES